MSRGCAKNLILFFKDSQMFPLWKIRERKKTLRGSIIQADPILAAT